MDDLIDNARRKRARHKMEEVGREVKDLVDEYDLSQSMMTKKPNGGTVMDRDVDHLLWMASAESFDQELPVLEEDVLDNVEIVPLSMKEDVESGLIDSYGTIQHGRHRDGEDPLLLAEPPEYGGKTRRKRVSEWQEEYESSDDDDEGDEKDVKKVGIERVESDPWLIEMDRLGESAYATTMTMNPSRRNRMILGDMENLREDKMSVESDESAKIKVLSKVEALERMNQILLEGPEGITVLAYIKHLAPSSRKSNVKSDKRDEYRRKEGCDENGMNHDSSFDRLVILADYLLGKGVGSIYSYSSKDIQSLLVKKDCENPNQNSSSTLKMWEYKWNPASESYGPYDSNAMKAWESIFSQYNTVLVRSLDPLDDGQWRLYRENRWI